MRFEFTLSGSSPLMELSCANPAIGIFHERIKPLSVCRFPARLLQFAGAGILSLALWMPFIGGIAPLLQSRTASCGMECCAGSKNCSCRAGRDAHQPGPAWTAAPACPRGCNERPSLPGAVALALVPVQIVIGQVAQNTLLRVYAASAIKCATIESALFERPPPSI